MVFIFRVKVCEIADKDAKNKPQYVGVKFSVDNTCKTLAYNLFFRSNVTLHLLLGGSLSAPNPSICFLLVDFHICEELIFEKFFLENYIESFFFLRALKVTEILKLLRALSPAGQIFVLWAH